MNKLYKTTMVVWTKDDPNNIQLKDLVENSETSYVSFKNSRLVEDPETDPHWSNSNPFTDKQVNDRQQ